MFIQVIQGPCSRPEELRAVVDAWKDGPGAEAKGHLGGTFGFTDDGLFIAVVRFESRELAMANSERPVQDEWAQRFAAAFDSTPEFRDYDDVRLMLDGGSDDAGFVQVIQGRVSDRAAVDALTSSDQSGLREMRPDIIGATLGIDADGGFTQTIAFVDEASARAGEAGATPPPEMEEAVGKLLDGAVFHDLHAPWFASP